MAAPGVTVLHCSKLVNLPLKRQFLLRFKLNGVYDKWGGTLNVVTLTCANSSVTLTTKQVMVEEGWQFLTQISSTKKGLGVVHIHVNGSLKKTLTFKFQDHPDVFDKKHFDLLTDELNYIKRQLKSDQNPNPHREYANNYCMQAAERGISEILDNDTDFYAVERDTHKHKNKIGFSKKNAFDRGKVFSSKGFVDSSHVFIQSYFKINHKDKDLIYKSKDKDEAGENWRKVRYTIISMSDANKTKVRKLFEKDLTNKELGFHFYYLTVTDAFHTLILVIDTVSDPCNPAYEIWDQHAKSTSHGPFNEIGEGIRRQTSWTFANTCLNRYKDGRTSKWDAINGQVWKIKEK